VFTCICLGTNDLKRASHFYDAALAPLGIQRCGGVEADTGDMLGGVRIRTPARRNWQPSAVALPPGNKAMLPISNFWKATARACLLALLALLAGATHAETNRQEYEAARQQWLAAEVHDYQFQFNLSCFCMAENHGDLRVVVKNDVVQGATWLNNGEAASAGYLRLIPSLSGVFQKIDAAYASHAEKIELRFNPDYGFPEQVFIDYSTRIADEEFRYTISHFSR
jgi:hypothetical protein